MDISASTSTIPKSGDSLGLFKVCLSHFNKLRERHLMLTKVIIRLIGLQFESISCKNKTMSFLFVTMIKISYFPYRDETQTLETDLYWV